jgi:hypothetical protein
MVYFSPLECLPWSRHGHVGTKGQGRSWATDSRDERHAETSEFRRLRIRSHEFQNLLCRFSTKWNLLFRSDCPWLSRFEPLSQRGTLAIRLQMPCCSRYALLWTMVLNSMVGRVFHFFRWERILFVGTKFCFAYSQNAFNPCTCIMMWRLPTSRTFACWRQVLLFSFLNRPLILFTCHPCCSEVAIVLIYG